ncbi:MAG TPA: flavodoxin family protein [Candidatus Limnocylindrales bacterium]|nr:flavodoxin family protein [Candidatus Limnocylindrales bacterium]
MKSVIILFSYHHKNTEKIAQVIAKVIGAEIKNPAQTDPSSVAGFDLVGFGSGVYYRKLSKPILEFADKIPKVDGKKAFIFSTSGKGGNASKFHKGLKEKLQAKGFTIAGEFSCPGFDTFGPFKLVGGANKGRPNDEDLKQAEGFAQKLLKNEASTVFVERK